MERVMGRQHGQSLCGKAMNSLLCDWYFLIRNGVKKEKFRYERIPFPLKTCVIIRLPENMWKDFVGGRGVAF